MRFEEGRDGYENTGRRNARRHLGITELRLDGNKTLKQCVGGTKKKRRAGSLSFVIPRAAH